MNRHKIFDMSFARIYALYVAKVERKGHTQNELNQVITWLTGYRDDELQETITNEISLESFLTTPH